MIGLSGGVDQVVAGSNVTVAGTPSRPVINATGGGGGIPELPMLKNNFMYTYARDLVMSSATTSSTAFGANTARAVRIRITQEILASAIVNRISGNGNVRIALYNGDVNGLPSGLELDMGEVAQTSGTTSTAIYTIPPGEYWLVYFIQNSINLRTVLLNAATADTISIPLSAISAAEIPIAARFDLSYTYPASTPATLASEAWAAAQVTGLAHPIFFLNS